ncbi:hypothetical protein ACU4GR_05955 [Methylobacterium oryzae CBMB20]
MAGGRPRRRDDVDVDPDVERHPLARGPGPLPDAELGADEADAPTACAAPPSRVRWNGSVTGRLVPRIVSVPIAA